MSSQTAKKARPLSPHLQVYKPQLTSGLSIFHRITGIGLSAALPVIVLWLVAIAEGPAAYATFNDYAHSLIGRIFLFGWSWALCFHFCTGLRYLIWDTGHLLDIKSVYLTGYLALAVSTLLTVAVWFYYL